MSSEREPIDLGAELYEAMPEDGAAIIESVAMAFLGVSEEDVEVVE